MADDIRTRLSEALDEAGKRARGLLVIAQQVRRELKDPKLLGTRIPGWGAWSDVEAMCERELRSVERDRQLLTEHDGWLKRDSEMWCRSSLLACEAELRRAAAFWLGTPEVDR